MKITKLKLKELIKEELEDLVQEEEKPGQAEQLAGKMMNDCNEIQRTAKDLHRLLGGGGHGDAEKGAPREQSLKDLQFKIAAIYKYASALKGKILEVYRDV